MQKKSKRPHVVIVGAGFGGLKTAQLLAKHPIDITIIDKNNYHLFQPLLYQISTAGLSVDDIAHPIRSIFCEKPNVDFHMAEVKQIDMDKKIIKEIIMTENQAKPWADKDNCEKHESYEINI